MTHQTSIIRKRTSSTVITDRDLNMLLAIHSFGILTRTQLQLLLAWKCVSDINRRLRKLCEFRYLERRHLAGRPLMSPAVYVLGYQGVQLLTRKAGVPETICEQRRRRYLKLAVSFLSHELEISEFGCQLRVALNSQTDAELLEWTHTGDICVRWAINEVVPDLSLIPDAGGSYRLGRRQFNFFLEMDRGTETLERLRSKVDYYRVLKASDLFEKRTPRRSFRLLFVTSSRQRAMNISSHLRSVTDLKIFIASLDRIDANMLSAAIWYKAGETGSYPLHSSDELNQRKVEDALLP